MISEEQIFDIIDRHLPAFKPISKLQSIPGGNLNHLWRLEGHEQNVIIKWAPPHIAANPEVPLSPKRLDFEAKALQLFADNNLLNSLISDRIRPPELFHFEADKHLIIMEDLGNLPTVANWVRSKIDPSVSKRLATFIGTIHKNTLNNHDIAQQFDNRDIQQTRQKVQYNPAADYLSKTGLGNGDSNQVSQKAKRLGQKLLEPGQCLVMGDLWPPSVLVDSGRLRIIDWEFVHFGRALQDVGHFAAHCWMQAHSSSSKESYKLFKKLWENFWDQYQQTLGDAGKQLLSSEEMDDMTTHIGAEILVRTVGPFQDGYVYERLSPAHPKIQEATRKAGELILNTRLSALWS